MRPHSYTELFFLDEATAFAAGHRPCAECRNADYRRFKSLWTARFGEPVSADIIDAAIHADRIERRRKVTYRAPLDALPNGTFVEVDDRPWLVFGDALYAWSDGGYSERRARGKGRGASVLTPRSIVEILMAGYAPDVHPTVRAHQSSGNMRYL